MGRKSILESDFDGRGCEDDGWIQMAHYRFYKGVVGRDKAHEV